MAKAAIEATDRLVNAATVECSAGGICKRCGEDPDKAHDNGFCPAFAKTSDVGRWIPFSNLLRAVRAECGNIEVRHSCRTEYHEGPRNEWTNVVGLYRDGEYLGRFDTPDVPEYSLWTTRRGQHSMLLKGWRASLRDISTKTGVRFDRIARRLRVNPDRTTEEIRRQITGYL